MIYENIMNYAKREYGEVWFRQNETYVNVVASFTAGLISSALTNPFECITVNKQTTPEFNIRQFIK